MPRRAAYGGCPGKPSVAKPSLPGKQPMIRRCPMESAGETAWRNSLKRMGDQWGNRKTFDSIRFSTQERETILDVAIST